MSVPSRDELRDELLMQVDRLWRDQADKSEVEELMRCYPEFSVEIEEARAAANSVRREVTSRSSARRKDEYWCLMNLETDFTVAVSEAETAAAAERCFREWLEVDTLPRNAVIRQLNQDDIDRLVDRIKVEYQAGDTERALRLLGNLRKRG